MAQISGSEREKIEKDAKNLLETFSKTLSKITFKERKSARELSGFRKERSVQNAGKDFRERMFANAPSTEADFIVAERKSW